LAATLASIAPAVDALYVNDNSGSTRGPNAATLEASPFAARGALHVERHPFVDFADMRNRAFAPLRALETPPDWVLFLDADEVHGEQLAVIARELLPRLGPRYGHLDAYTYHFFGTFGWLTDVARRFVFYRFAPGLHWTNAIHEKLQGLGGEALVIPYIYHHYGNVATPRALAEKHQKYFALGNRVPEPPTADRADAEIFLASARDVRPFGGRHPAVVRTTLRQLEARYAVLRSGRARRCGERTRRYASSFAGWNIPDSTVGRARRAELLVSDRAESIHKVLHKRTAAGPRERRSRRCIR
jgi:hypothetical protein